MKNRILVIDDDIELCELLNEYLGSEGFEVETVNHGEEGALQALANDYALVVLDVMLPGMNGFDVLRKIRESNTNSATLSGGMVKTPSGLFQSLATLARNLLGATPAETVTFNSSLILRRISSAINVALPLQ